MVANGGREGKGIAGTIFGSVDIGLGQHHNCSSGNKENNLFVFSQWGDSVRRCGLVQDIPTFVNHVRI